MPHLWQKRDDGHWEPESLAPTSDDAGARASQDVAARVVDPRDRPRILPAPSGGAVLLEAPRCEVSVNGEECGLGIRVMDDRDEIAFPNRTGETVRQYFSTESLATVVPFPDTAPSARCPRCKSMIEAEMPAVRCPQCGAWHHEGAVVASGGSARNCWTYAERCALCSQATALDAGYQWTPECL